MRPNREVPDYRKTTTAALILFQPLVLMFGIPTFRYGILGFAALVGVVISGGETTGMFLGMAGVLAALYLLLLSGFLIIFFVGPRKGRSAKS